MMRREPIGLGHRELLVGRLKGVRSPISEYCFPNLYLYRGVHKYEVVFGDDVYVSGVSYDGGRFIMPTADLSRIDIGALIEASREYDFIYPVPEDRAELFEGFPVSVSCDEGDSDYIYSTVKMSEYPGRRLHKKRNLLKHFERSYKHMEMPLTTERLPDAELVLKAWLAASGQKAGETDYYPCLESLRLYDELVLCGGIYYAEGEPAGFVIGEEISTETFLLHFSKADIRFKGIYQYIYSSFASLLPEKYGFVNVEQDLNIEAIRRSKRSYQPDVVLKKMRVATNDQGT